MARKITLAVLQSALTDDADKNIKRISDLVREAASKGANVILPSELFEGHYFCTSQEEGNFARAYAWRESPAVKAMAKLAAELGVVIPVSIFEKAGPHYFNSVVMIDADGTR
jgi:N-carbamoylputrescine amidase